LGSNATLIARAAKTRGKARESFMITMVSWRRVEEERLEISDGKVGWEFVEDGWEFACRFIYVSCLPLWIIKSAESYVATRGANGN
jgi:hypothetical protein